MKGKSVKGKSKSKPTQRKPKIESPERKPRAKPAKRTAARKPAEEKPQRHPRLRGTRPTIGFLTADVHGSTAQAIWRGVVDTAQSHDVNLICFVGQSVRDPNGFLAQANVLYDLASAERLDGLLYYTSLAGRYLNRDENLAFVRRYGVPVVSFAPLEGIPSVFADSYYAMREEVTHLIENHGCRRLALISGVEQHPATERRYQAYRDALEEHQISFDPNLVTPYDTWHRATGVKGIALLLDERGLRPGSGFDAVVAASDVLALGALEALQERGVRVPEDVALVGFNDLPEARVITPPLTTVAMPFYEEGVRGAEALLALLAGENIPEQILLEATLVVRQSCGCQSQAVSQAMTGSLKPRRRSLNTALKTQREEILAEMVQAASLPSTSLNSRCAGQLLDAFAADLKAKSPGGFVVALNEVLRQVAAMGSDVAAWQDVLSALRRSLLPYLEGSALVQAEDLWHQARVVIEEAVQRACTHQALQAEQQAQALREFVQSLITTFSVQDLMDMLADGLPKMGISSAYLSLYENPDEPAGWSKLALAYGDKGPVKLAAGGVRFPSSQLVPEGMMPQRRYSYMVEPLFTRDNQLGFALFEVGPRDGDTYDTLRAQISSALRGATLVQRLEHRAIQLQTAAEVSRATSSILNVDQLLPQVVDLARERFDLYYAGLFLVDQTGEWTGEPNRWAVLRAGTGEAGQKMLKQGHKLEIGGASMIGWCIANKQARTALDVAKDALRFKNPHLPETRSEMALPLISRGEAIGALTIQSTQEAAFSEEDAAVLQTMADQLANAIANARLYEAGQTDEESERRFREKLSRLHEVSNELSKAPTFDDLCHQAMELGHSRLDFDRMGIWFRDEEDPQFMVGSFGIDENGQIRDERGKRLAITPGQANAVILTGQAPTVFEPDIPLRDDKGTVVGRGWQVVTAIRDADKVIGRISADNLLRGQPIETYQLELLRLYGVTLGHLCTRKRAEEVLERRAVQLQAAAEVAREAVTIRDVRQLLDRTVHLISERFGFYHAGVFLLDEHREYATLGAASSAGGRRMLERGHRLEVGETSIVGYAVATGEPRIALDVGVDAVFFDNPDLPDTRSEMALPLKVRDRVIGVLDVQSNEPSAFATEDVTTLQTMADQLAGAIDNARLYEALGQEQYFMRALLDSSPDNIYFKDTDSRFLRISAAMARWFGLSEEAQAIGKTDFDFFTEDHARPAYEDEQEIIRTGQIVAKEERETWPDRPDSWASTTKMPLRDEEGRIVGTFGISRDITARKQAEATLERRAVQLQAASEVAREATGILDVRQLLDRTVHLISERFGFYHAGVFLLDEHREYAILRAASSAGGRRMLERGHRLKVGETGIVGYAAATGEPRIALDVGTDAVFFDNPDLPDTRSEMALPLKLRGGVIGVLDVQSNEPSAFATEDVTTLQTMADQLAVAIDNASLIERTESQLRELRLLYGEYSAATWSKVTARGMGYVYDRTGVSPATDAPLPALDMAMQNRQTVNIVEPEAEGAMLAIPLKVREQVIGTLGLQTTDGGREWSSEEVALVEAVGEQVALALENAQLFAETQRTAQSMEALYETSRALSTSLEEESLMHAILEGVYRTLSCEHVIISTVDEEAGTIGIKHGIWQGEFDHVPEWADTSRHSLDQPNILTDVYRTGRTEIVAGWDARLNREVYEKFGHERFLRIFMPVTMRERTLAIVEVGYDRRQKDRVTEEEVQMLAAFMDQAAVALENAHLFEQAQRRAQREHQIYEITSRIRRSPDISAILQTTVDELGRALRTDRAIVRLIAKPRAKQ